MKKFHRTASAAVVLAAVFASTASAAMAVPPRDTDPIPRCPTGYRMVDDVCVKVPPPPPPPPSISPVVSLDMARQTTDRAAIRVVGRASDGDQPQTALTVKISVDGVQAKTLTANMPDPPVATPRFARIPPPTLPGHSYDVVIPAAPTAQQVCVTAVNVGSGSDRTVCKQVDAVVEFAGNSISYDLDQLQITAASLESLDRVTNTNSTNVQQSTTISGEKTVTDTQGWSNTYGVKVTISGGIKIPLVSDFKVTVEGSASWTQNGSTSTTRKFAWQQPVLVPAKSKVVATVAVTKTTLTVPYTLSGDYVYSSGARVAGTNGGTFTGVTSHDLEVTLTQFNLDGTPAARPIQQPQASLLKVS
jgi:Clostridium epsilon toxin ETX/Bacillus mosquitocidal toxin MTX2